jgi:hypothetical protein
MTADNDTGRPDKSSCTDDGAREHRTSGHEGIWTSLSLNELIDEDTHVSVTGVAFDDEPGSVALSITSSTADLQVGVSPERARALAEDLLEAAEAAERSV